MSTAAAHFQQGNQHLQQGQLDAAVAAYRAGLALDPDSPDLHGNLSIALARQGRTGEALEHAEAAAGRAPANAGCHVNHALMLNLAGRAREAVEAYERALSLDRGLVPARLGLFRVLRDLGLNAAAAEHGQYLHDLNPGDFRVAAQLALTQLSAGRAEAAQKILGTIDPAGAAGRDVPTMTTRAFVMNYIPGLEAGAQLAAHIDVARAIEAGLGAGVMSPREFHNPREADRVIRLGFLSPDFNASSVAAFALGLYEHLDRERFEIVSYFSGERVDRFTERFHSRSNSMRPITRMSDEEATAQIRRDGVDVLVDLAGLVRGGRPGVLARRAAPVQVTYIGYPNTTGLRAVDARLVDGLTDPADLLVDAGRRAERGADRWAVERLLRLDPCFLAYTPYDRAPEAAPPPSLREGNITFCSFNQLMKLNNGVIAAWARLLAAVPGSRLLLKAGELADPRLREEIPRRFGQAGVDPLRVACLPRTPEMSGHLAVYAQADIALDPFPYHGTTTTCEALQMGLPVVALAGERHAGRVGASLLAAIGKQDWVARSVEEYITIAAGLAADPAALARLRQGLRGQLQSSTLWDAAWLTLRFEAAIRGLWAAWCTPAD